MFSPEGGLCNNNHHDKREHMQQYGAYTLQGITPTHGLTGCTDRTMSSVGGVLRGLPRVSVCVGHNVLQGEGFGRENREPGAEMDEEEEAEEEGDFDSHCYCLIMMQSSNGSMGWWPLDGQKQVQSLHHGSERQNTEGEEGGQFHQTIGISDFVLTGECVSHTNND